MFSILAVALVAVVLIRYARNRAPTDSAPHHHTGTEGASRTASGSAERKERKRRRAQSRTDRRKRH